MTLRRAALAAALQLGAARAGAEAMLVRIEAPVSVAQARWVEGAAREAARSQRPLVLIVDAREGRLDAAARMRDALLHADVPTTCLVTREAIDEAALACLGASRVELMPRARLGGSVGTRVMWSAAVSSRRLTRLHDEIVATASARGRPAAWAESLFARADPIPAPPDVTAVGGELPPGSVQVMPRLLAIAARFTGPVVSGVLLALGLLGVLVEVKIPSRIAGATGLLALAAFFTAHGIAGLAGLAEAALGTLGLVLLAVEIFVLPGFGACGMLGLLFFGAGVLLALAGHDLDLALAAGTLRTALVVGSSASLGAAVALAVVLQVAGPRDPPAPVAT